MGETFTELRDAQRPYVFRLSPPVWVYAFIWATVARCKTKGCSTRRFTAKFWTTTQSPQRTKQTHTFTEGFSLHSCVLARGRRYAHFTHVNQERSCAAAPTARAAVFILRESKDACR